MDKTLDIPSLATISERYSNFLVQANQRNTCRLSLQAYGGFNNQQLLANLGWQGLYQTNQRNQSLISLYKAAYQMTTKKFGAEVQVLKKLLESNAQLRSKSKTELLYEPYVAHSYLYDNPDDKIIYDGNGEIISCDLLKLIEKSTENMTDLKDVIILTAPLFCEPQRLLKLLYVRAAVPNPLLGTPSEIQQFEQNKKDQIIAKVAIFIKS